MAVINERAGNRCNLHCLRIPTSPLAGGSTHQRDADEKSEMRRPAGNREANARAVLRGQNPSKDKKNKSPNTIRRARNRGGNEKDQVSGYKSVRLVISGALRFGLEAWGWRLRAASGGRAVTVKKKAEEEGEATTTKDDEDGMEGGRKTTRAMALGAC